MLSEFRDNQGLDSKGIGRQTISYGIDKHRLFIENLLMRILASGYQRLI